MSPPTMLTAAQLMRFVGLPDAPDILDVRAEADHAADARLLPCGMRRDAAKVADWAAEYPARHVVAVCQQGHALSQGVAAWLRHAGAYAESLEGGFAAWAASDGLRVRPETLPPSGERGRTLWVTCARLKVDRIACPWLICRFVDPGAAFLFVAPAEVDAVAERFSATPFMQKQDHAGWIGARGDGPLRLDAAGIHRHGLHIRGDGVAGSECFQPLAPLRKSHDYRGK